MIDPIEALADCIMRFEGWAPPGSTIGGVKGSTSWRNRNPGNLRDSTYKEGIDDKGYAYFSSMIQGWGALMYDLKAKFNGSHNLTPQSTLHQLFSIYAPPTDNNDPQQYSRTIALWMSKIYNAQVTPDWTLENILKLGK